MRVGYVRLEGNTVRIFCNLVACDPIKGEPCFQIGYAVPEIYRRQGRARNDVSAAVRGMDVGLGGNGISTFYVEAVVGADNLAPRRVAETVISPTAAEITDALSREPALQYVRQTG